MKVILVNDDKNCDPFDFDIGILMGFGKRNTENNRSKKEFCITKINKNLLNTKMDKVKIKFAKQFFFRTILSLGLMVSTRIVVLLCGLLSFLFTLHF